MSALGAGLRIQQRYTLLARIGAGGMSEVWHAEDEVLGRPVAVKALSPRLAQDEALRAGVRAEARAVARLDHPHITRVYDYGETALPDGTHLAYLVMELVQGQTLAARLASGPLPWPAAVQLTAQVAAALAEAHRVGLVHRDVKPGNVMLTAHGAKVLDFGIAAVARPAPPRPSVPSGPTPPPGTLGGDAPRARAAPGGDAPRIGTPAYAAPEWLLAAPPDPAVDVYGLGALLYEALTDQPPIRARTWAEAAQAHRDGPRIPPPEAPGLPPRVAALCLACLAPAPGDRPRAIELAAALRSALRGAGYRSLGRNRSAKAGSAASVASTSARRHGTPVFRDQGCEDDTGAGNGHWRAGAQPVGEAGPARSNRGWFGRWATRNRLAGRERPPAPPGPGASLAAGTAVSLAAGAAAPPSRRPRHSAGRARSRTVRQGRAALQPTRLLSSLAKSVRRGPGWPPPVPPDGTASHGTSQPIHPSEPAGPAEHTTNRRALVFWLLATAVAIVVGLTIAGIVMVSRGPTSDEAGMVPPLPIDLSEPTADATSTAAPATAPASRGPTAVARQPTAGATRSPSTSAAPPPTRPNPGVVADEFERLLAEAAANGQVRSDVALDLHNSLDALRQRINLGQPGDLRGAVAQLRHKIEVRLTEHAIDPSPAAQLTALLDTLLH